MPKPAPFLLLDGLRGCFWTPGPDGTADVWYQPHILCCRIHPAGQFDAAEIAEKFVRAAKEEGLPKLSDLKGIAPDATGELFSEDFVRNLRNEW